MITRESVKLIDAPQRCAIVQCVHGEGAIFYVNLLQLQEFLQNTHISPEMLPFYNG